MYSNIYEVLFDIEAIWNACITYNGVFIGPELLNRRVLIFYLWLPVPTNLSVEMKLTPSLMTVGIYVFVYE